MTSDFQSAAGGQTISQPISGRIEAALRSVNRRPGFCLTILTLLLAAHVNPWWIPETDGCSYLSMARSLASQGRMLNLGNSHLWFFPGYSLLLSPLYLIQERPIWLLSAFQWGSAILFMVGVYRWAKSVAPEWALWIAAVCAVNEGLWVQSARTMSEVPFMCGWIWSVNAAIAAANSSSARKRLCWGIAAGALLTITCLIRPAGIMLAIGVGFCLGWKALRKEISWARAIVLTLVIGIPASLAIMGVMRSSISTATEASRRTYINEFGDAAANPLQAYLEGARFAIRDSGRVAVPGMFKSYQNRGWHDPNLIVFIPACVLLAAGWWRLTRKTGDPLLLAAPFYVLMHIAHPFEVGGRFHIPLLPVFIASFACLLALLRAAPARVASLRIGLALTAGLFAAHLFASSLYWLKVDAPRARAVARRGGEIEQIVRELDSNLDSVCVSGLGREDLLMLELEIDRPVACCRGGSVPSEAEWILAGRKSTGIPRFELCAENESFRLLRRNGSSRPAGGPLAAQ